MTLYILSHLGMPSPAYFPLEKLSAAVPDAAAFTAPSSHKYILRNIEG
jgi:hypothetical protein